MLEKSTDMASSRCIVAVQMGYQQDPPGTIDPAKLMVPGIAQPQDLLVTPPQSPDIHFETGSYWNGCINTRSEDNLYHRRLSRQSRLPRISSDREVCGTFGVVSHWIHLEAAVLWRKFDQFCDRDDALSRLHARSTEGHSSSQSAMHSRYFRWQTRPGHGLCLVPDPAAGLRACVVVENSNCSIWDAYLLRVDVSKNLNWFKRQQVSSVTGALHQNAFPGAFGEGD